MKGRPYMYTRKNKADNLESLVELINNMIEEHEAKLSDTIQKKSDYISAIKETEAIIYTLSHSKEKNANLFSPNSREICTSDYEEQLQITKEKLINIESQEQTISEKIMGLKEIKEALLVQKTQDLNLGHNILELQEQDRQRIARDLHDSTVQNLTSIVHKCELCLKLVDIDPVRTKLELSTMSNTVKSVINEIREIIYNLKPMSLDDLGLVTTIERYTEQLMMNHDIQIQLDCSKERYDILPVIKLSIYRIIQEACNNAIKHAEAKTIDIKLIYDEKNLNLSIADDGKGFDAECKRDSLTSEHSGYGLCNMKERVYLLSGTLKIESTKNKGTILTITIPIMKSEGEK